MTYSVKIPLIGSFESWRAKARLALSHQIAPEDISWNDDAGGLFGGVDLPDEIVAIEAKVPAAYFDLAKTAVWHSEPQRYSILYTALWRIAKSDGHPISPVDPLGATIHRMAKSVRRDIHKMHAFVRFQELPSDTERRRFIAWFEPEHFITEPGSSFFAKRFADMDWMIATPTVCASFDGRCIAFSEYSGKPILPGDDIEGLWGTYFANIFNPARIKLNAMRSEMPVKYWKNMPETKLIPEMLANADSRVQKMRDAMPSVAPVGAERISTRYRAQLPQAVERASSLEDLETALQKCRRCRLCETATQAVPGIGRQSAKLMIVGEQPGDREDLEGRPFVGPAGSLLTKIIEEVGLPRENVYLTNAVKHFKFSVSGKKRIHQNPNRSEIDHCRWWLDQEIEFVKPKVILALGASASYGVTGNIAKQSDRRGTIEPLANGSTAMFSWHPFYILRLPNDEARRVVMAQFRQDIASALERSEQMFSSELHLASAET